MEIAQDHASMEIAQDHASMKIAQDRESMEIAHGSGHALADTTQYQPSVVGYF